MLTSTGAVCRKRVAGAGLSPAPATVSVLQLRSDRLDFGVGLEDLVAHLAAPAGPGAKLLRQGVGLGDVLGPDPGAETVGAVVRLGGDLVQAAERLGHDDR